MTEPRSIAFADQDLDAIQIADGHVAIVASSDGKMGPAARRANRLTKGAVKRVLESEAWEKLDAAGAISLAWPTGIAAEGLHLVKLDRNAAALDARKGGGAIGKAAGSKAVLVCAGSLRHASDLALGLALRGYNYDDQKSSDADDVQDAIIQVLDPEKVTGDHDALAAGVFFTRDLVNAPANVLTTTSFADQLAAMTSIGLEVEVMEEDRLEQLGMGSLLSVGQGSASPSKVVVMKWMGGGDEAPLALVGKGVVFDTGGISLKPAGGMEEMTMDMGGAGVVSGVMKTVALRKAKANIVGLVGLVENMPSGTATRPGDVVTSMKGDTIEVINTDAEGRLVLADVMWYAQEFFQPAAMIDLATLTGACIIALGHENAGVFADDDALCNALLKAAATEEEGAWRLPLGKGYADQLKSRVADVKNVGGRPAGATTAAEFLKRFVQDGVPWAHIDIAGVATTKGDTALAPKGASGWGVMTLNRLIADRFEG